MVNSSKEPVMRQSMCKPVPLHHRDKPSEPYDLLCPNFLLQKMVNITVRREGSFDWCRHLEISWALEERQTDDAGKSLKTRRIHIKTLSCTRQSTTQSNQLLRA